MADAAEQLRKMETALNKIGLGTLAQKFCDEKLDFKTLLAASDKELTQLGFVTIGDKVRLRQLCQRKTEGGDDWPSTSSGAQTNSASSAGAVSSWMERERRRYPDVVRERSFLFRPGNNSIA